jgi:glycosyltransferase involved in cell wall biosynthesis
MSGMDITVVICTYNRAALLRRALGSLAAMRVPPDLGWEIVVVDNNSSDDTPAVVREAADRGGLPCRYLFEGRQGKSHALNAGVRAAAGEIIALTDDDVLVHEGWLAAIRRAFAENDCLAAGGRIVARWSHPRPRWYVDSGPHKLTTVIVEYDRGDVLRPVQEAPFGANQAFRRAAFERYGMFDTRLGRVGARLTSGEDTEMCQRLLDAGETILYIPDAIVYHPVEAERLRRRYFRSWYWHAGRSSMHVAGACRRWLGVPRYVIRSAAEHGARWVTAVDPKRRFYHELNFIKCLGHIVEAFGARGGPAHAPEPVDGA